MPKRLLVAIAGSFPVAVVAAVSLGLAINLGDAISAIFFWMVWGASILYAVREVEPRRVFGRTAVSYAVAAFTLPLTAAVFAFTAYRALESSMTEAEGALEGFLSLLFGAALLEIFLIIAVVAGVFGVITGLVAILLVRSFLRRQATGTPDLEEGDTLVTGDPRSVPSAFRRFADGGLRRVRLGNKGTVIGLGLVALILAVIAGIAVYGILVSSDTQELSLAAVPTSAPTFRSESTQAPEPISTPLPRATPYPAGDADLYGAIKTGDVEQIQSILDAGASVNASNTDGDPFIHEAIWRDHIDVVRVLVGAGADVNAVDSEGNPVLREAIWRGHTEIVSLLIDARADVNAVDSEGNPVLYEAIWRGHTEIVSLLVGVGADVNAKDTEGNSMLHEAMWREHTDIEAILREAGAVELP